MLAFDTSNSMAGAKFTQAKAAALSYLDAVPDNVYVGMVTFDDSVDVAREPTLDRDEMRATIRSLHLADSTSLNQGVMEAVSLTGELGGRNVLVLSDGRDTTGTPLTDVLTTVKASGAKVDVVALQQSGDRSRGAGPYRQGRQGNRDPALWIRRRSRRRSRTRPRNLTRQVLVTADVPTGHKTDGNVEVSIDAGDQTWTDTAYTTVREKAEARRCTGRTGPRADLLVHPDHADAGRRGRPPSASASSGSCSRCRCGARPETISARGPDRRVRRHRQAPGREEARTLPATTSITGAATARASQRARQQPVLEAQIAKRLEGAASSLRPAEWLLLHGGIAMVTALVFLLLSGGNVILLLVGLLVGAWSAVVLPRLQAEAADQGLPDRGLPDTLQLMAGSLSAGLSLAQSTDTIVREGTEPITSEFKRVIVESRLGVPLEDAIEGVAERMESRDFEWVVMAIRIQREVGGNLAELLLTVAATLREREYLRRHVRALSAEGRSPRYVLGGLPPAFLVYLALSKPDYVKPLFTTPIG